MKRRVLAFGSDLVVAVRKDREDRAQAVKVTACADSHGISCGGSASRGLFLPAFVARRFIIGSQPNELAFKLYG